LEKRAGCMHACLSHPPRRLWTRFSDPPFRPEPNACKRLLTSSYSRAISSVSLPRERYQPPRIDSLAKDSWAPLLLGLSRHASSSLCAQFGMWDSDLVWVCDGLHAGRSGRPSFFLSRVNNYPDLRYLPCSLSSVQHTSFTCSNRCTYVTFLA
jgi:hypothetical protein